MLYIGDADFDSVVKTIEVEMRHRISLFDYLIIICDSVSDSISIIRATIL